MIRGTPVVTKVLEGLGVLQLLERIITTPATDALRQAASLAESTL